MPTLQALRSSQYRFTPTPAPPERDHIDAATAMSRSAVGSTTSAPARSARH